MTVAGIVYDRWAMIVSGGLMMASPLVVIVGRLVQAENGFVVMYLGTVLMVALSMKIEKYRKVFWYLAAVIGSLGLWFKMTGIVSLVFLVFWGLRYGKMMALSYKEWMSPILGFGLISLGFWVIYGYVIDWNQFWLILQSNSGRVYGIGYEAIYNLITKGKVTNTVFLTDPIVFMGWLGWLILLFRWRGDNWKEGIVHLGICSYLIIYLFVGSYPYGWYHVPFYPFLMIGVGSLFSKLKYEKFNLLVLLILLWMTLGWLIELNVKYELRSLYVNIWKLLVVGSLGMGMMLVNARQKRWLSSALYLLLVAVIGMSVWRIYLVSGENWFRVG